MSNQSSTSVTKERWEEAQAWELKAWEKQEKWHIRLIKQVLVAAGLRNDTPGDDWNHWWQEQYNNYDFVPSKLENALELGCGPYTNMRLIREGREFNYTICSDPLAHHYIHFRSGWLANSYRNGSIIVDNHPAEEAPFANDYFDLVVMINVLDHVQDATQCIEIATNLTKSGGIFILGQDLTNEEDIANETHEDIGHPIRLHHDDLGGGLKKNFNPIIHKVLSREEGRAPEAHYGTLVFAGTKL